MNIEIKAQVAEWERLDKERTQEPWELGYPSLEDANRGNAALAILYKNKHNCYRKLAECRTSGNAVFIAQAPAMFQAVKQLMARVEELEFEKQKEAAENDILLNGMEQAHKELQIMSKEFQYITLPKQPE